MFLAKALANGQPLEQLKHLWITEGDFEKLVNDGESVADIKGRRAKRALRQSPPPSLLNGQRLYLKVLGALDDMHARGPGGQHIPPGPPLVDQVDLFVTATDVSGVETPIALADKVVREKRHRAVWRLSFSPGKHSDFGFASNPLLAFASRSTAAFPFAFAPVSLDDVKPIAALLRDGQDVLEPGTEARMFADYHAIKDPYSATRCFGDGGSLDNKPFSWIVNELPRRRSTVPVDRRLLFVEPDPGDPSPVSDAPSRPDPLTNAIAQALLLPASRRSATTWIASGDATSPWVASST